MAKSCQNCGTQNADDGLYCLSCGRSLGKPSQMRQDPDQPPYPPPPPYGTRYGGPYNPHTPPFTRPQKAYAQNYAVNLIKSVGASRPFLAATVLYSVNFLIQAVQAVVGLFSYGSPEFLEGYYGMLYDYGLGDMTGDVMDILYGLPNAITVANLVSLALPLLTCLGLWMFYHVSRGADGSDLSTSGLTLIKVSVMISNIALLVILSLAEVFLVIDATAAGSGVSGYGDYGGYAGESVVLMGVLLFLAVILAGLICLLIFYLRGLVKTINVAASGLRTGALSGRVSMFVVAMNYVAAGFLVIGALRNMGSSFISSLSGLSSAAVLALISVCITDFKRQADDSRGDHY